MTIPTALVDVLAGLLVDAPETDDPALLAYIDVCRRFVLLARNPDTFAVAELKACQDDMLVKMAQVEGMADFAAMLTSLTETLRELPGGWPGA